MPISPSMYHTTTIQQPTMLDYTVNNACNSTGRSYIIKESFDPYASFQACCILDAGSCMICMHESMK